MAEAAAAAAVPGAEGVAAGGGKKAGLIAGLTFAGALLGGLVAALVVAPKIIARQAPAAPADSAAKGEPAGGEKAGEGKAAEGEGGEKKMVQLANIIVNPMGSQGTRFLMTSVAISTVNEEAQKLLTDHEVELRDKITSILETQTMAQLTAPGARDTLKARIAIAAGSIVGPKVPLKVFLPQFVIQ